MRGGTLAVIAVLAALVGVAIGLYAALVTDARAGDFAIIVVLDAVVLAIVSLRDRQ